MPYLWGAIPNHHGGLARRVNNIDFGPRAEMDLAAAQIRWFDYWLKGLRNGVDEDSPVRIFVMGDNQWRDEQSWPLHRTKEKILYIMSDGAANTPEGDGRLTDTAVFGPGADRYEYDPRDPVRSFSYGGDRLPSDQRRLAAREDVAFGHCFVGRPLVPSNL